MLAWVIDICPIWHHTAQKCTDTIGNVTVIASAPLANCLLLLVFLIDGEQFAAGLNKLNPNKLDSQPCKIASPDDISEPELYSGIFDHGSVVCSREITWAILNDDDLSESRNVYPWLIVMFELLLKEFFFKSRRKVLSVSFSIMVEIILTAVVLLWWYQKGFYFLTKLSQSDV